MGWIWGKWVGGMLGMSIIEAGVQVSFIARARLDLILKVGARDHQKSLGKIQMTSYAGPKNLVNEVNVLTSPISTIDLSEVFCPSFPPSLDPSDWINDMLDSFHH